MDLLKSFMNDNKKLGKTFHIKYNNSIIKYSFRANNFFQMENIIRIRKRIINQYEYIFLIILIFA